MISTVLRTARSVLQLESQAVKDQIRNLDRSFVQVVETLHALTQRGGQIVVMGIGKSGLVGRKIAATLSSTGTPAIFLHPTEGLHGDLGMLQPADGLLVLSASGETEEIQKILPILKERDLVLIAITSQRKSRLAKSADFVICSAVKKEACPMNLTPTASTTAMLAIGDALAICLMEKKGFKPSDFARLHPGGSIGKKLSFKVKDLMHVGKSNPIVRWDSRVQEALLEMSRTRMGATHVVDGQGKLVGFFTDGDLRRHLQKKGNILDRPLKELMTKNPKTISPEKTAYEALQLIQTFGFDNLPVVDETGKPVGILD
ncbi:MAG: KpsF/GutQ family sugar-phosphate isomerase, partial [Elusimicrobia bacterium]|nr:KpsF/GutQ family sugar-phosphate isomerase [Elusimicrobiota bacterium]